MSPNSAVDMAEHSMCTARTPTLPRETPTTAHPASRLPQHEIQRIPFTFVDLYACTRAQVGQSAFPTAAVPSNFATAYKTSPSQRHSIAVVDQLTDHFDDFGQILCSTRLAVSRATPSSAGPHPSHG